LKVRDNVAPAPRDRFTGKRTLVSHFQRSSDWGEINPIPKSTALKVRDNVAQAPRDRFTGKRTLVSHFQRSGDWGDINGLKGRHRVAQSEGSTDQRDQRAPGWVSYTQK